MRSFFPVACLVILLASCGAQPSEEVGTVVQAQNHGQVCQGANGGPYDPFNPSQGWPLHGWCLWMPGPDGNISPGCNATVAPHEVQGYNQVQPARHSSCARWQSGTDLDFAHMAYNGWDGLLGTTTIRTVSFEIGPRTWFSMSRSPSYSSTDGATIANCTDATVYRYNPPFEVASALVYSYTGPCLD